MAGGNSASTLVGACGVIGVTLGGIQAFVPSSGGAVTSPRIRSQGLRGAQAAGPQAAAQAGGQPAGALAVGAALGAVAAAVATASARQRASRASTGSQRAQPQRGHRVAMAAGAAVGKKRVLVMGGTRFIGCYLVKHLRDQGHDVVVCNRGKTNGGKPEPLPGMSDAEYQQMLQGVSVLVVDRKNPDALKAAVAGAGKFDIVYDNNARKLSDVEPLVAGIEANGGCEQFIFMSSAGVYGPTSILPLSEATPGDPNSRHKEKLSCETYLNIKGYNWTSIRPVYIYGPLNYNPVERFFFDRVARGRPICVPFGGKFITQLGHCEDLASFMVACIGNPAVSKQAYNLSGEEYVTFDGMARACAEAAGAPEPKIVHYDAKAVKVPEGYPKAFPFRGMHFFASINKAKQDVPTWKPKYSLLDGLRSSYLSDYVARGFDKREVDFRTDDLILQAAGGGQAGGSAAPSASGAIAVGSEAVWNGKKGTVRFVGSVKFAPGEWVGLELSDDSGMHNGTVMGVEYFECPPRRGVFAQASALGGGGSAAPSAAAAPAAAAPAAPAASGPAVAVGSKVLWNGKEGVVRHVGSVKFASGEWVGVELTGDGGLHNGTVMGVEYFTCAPGKGIFCQAAALTLL